MDIRTNICCLLLLVIACVNHGSCEEKIPYKPEEGSEPVDFELFVQSFLAHLLNSAAFSDEEKNELKTIIDTMGILVDTPRKHEFPIRRKMKIFNLSVLSSIAQLVMLKDDNSYENMNRVKQKSNAVAKALTAAFKLVSGTNKKLLFDLGEMVDMFSKLEQEEIESLALKDQSLSEDRDIGKEQNDSTADGEVEQFLRLLYTKLVSLTKFRSVFNDATTQDDVIEVSESMAKSIGNAAEFKSVGERLFLLSFIQSMSDMQATGAEEYALAIASATAELLADHGLLQGGYINETAAIAAKLLASGLPNRLEKSDYQPLSSYTVHEANTPLIESRERLDKIKAVNDDGDYSERSKKDDLHKNSVPKVLVPKLGDKNEQETNNEFHSTSGQTDNYGGSARDAESGKSQKAKRDTLVKSLQQLLESSSKFRDIVNTKITPKVAAPYVGELTSYVDNILNDCSLTSSVLLEAWLAALRTTKREIKADDYVQSIITLVPGVLEACKSPKSGPESKPSNSPSAAMVNGKLPNEEVIHEQRELSNISKEYQKQPKSGAILTPESRNEQKNQQLQKPAIALFEQALHHLLSSSEIFSSSYKQGISSSEAISLAFSIAKSLANAHVLNTSGDGFYYSHAYYQALQGTSPATTTTEYSAILAKATANVISEFQSAITNPISLAMEVANKIEEGILEHWKQNGVGKKHGNKALKKSQDIHEDSAVDHNPDIYLYDDEEMDGDDQAIPRALSDIAAAVESKNFESSPKLDLINHLMDALEIAISVPNTPK